MDWLQSISWIGLLKCFVIGGIICVIGQILIDKTKLTPARILVIFVTTGAILGGLGIYQYLVEFAGAGATVPLTGFGYNLAKGAIKGVKESGIVGAFTIPELHEKARLTLVSNVSIQEGSAHDVILKEIDKQFK